MVIGGAEDKLGQRTILSRFVKFAGGASARIAVVATASSLGDEATELYRALFLRLGAQQVDGVRPVTRGEANDPAHARVLDQASGVFLTGGNQVKLATVVAGTKLGDALHRAHDRGAVIGGTSAGASAVSTHMVSFGAGGTTPKQRMAQLSSGLGLLEGVIVDQHFDQRGRIGRLLALVAHSPNLLGLGVDEDTAAIVTDGHVLTVVGKGAVTLVDGRNVESNVHEARRSSPLLVSGAVLHSLPNGARFDLSARALLPGLADITPENAPAAVKDALAAKAATRRLVRRIAAEGADPKALARRDRRRGLASES